MKKIVFPLLAIILISQVSPVLGGWDERIIKVDNCEEARTKAEEIKEEALQKYDRVEIAHRPSVSKVWVVRAFNWLDPVGLIIDTADIFVADVEYDNCDGGG